MDNILCYGDHDLSAFLTGELGEDEAKDLCQHLEGCEICLARIEELDRELSAQTPQLMQAQAGVDESSPLSEAKIQAMVERASNRNDVKNLYS